MIIQSTAFAGTTKPNERNAAIAAPSSTFPAIIKANVAPGDTEKAKAADGAEPTKAELKTAVDKLNQSMTASSQDLEFSVDEDTKQTVVKLIDRNTLEVLRQMPSKEALDMAKSIDKAMGKLIDQRA